ncbi:pyridoxamine 5'-phosphate oxidase family protein [Streptomyces sp. XD-27]|uniref:helix-turn-helix domain-containing protein n=1 Tax=Streptomyces sp. XD-27 TaxID=3062779 RepID=UPI0026F45E23|nr:pyridoxamine 5'-phosphate oxidase family protein [Streptomyces sp. XD-27]WKX69022.1 pyridoxamine 5'-phosphate oxidase family protein [Streptomyces sp. XD-27]
MHGDPDPSGPAAGASSGDDSIATRVALRRKQLGMSREEVAIRAGMSIAYLRRVEELGTGLDPAALMRLAAVLEMPYEELTAGRRDAPPGRGGPAAHPVLMRLSEQECWQRLGTHGIGRLAYTAGGAPVLLPVNFLVDGRSVVYRTDPAGPAAVRAGAEVAFETDHVDEVSGLGWSVLVAGTAEHLTDPDMLDALARRPGAKPWAGADASCGSASCRAR